ncbi:MAG: DUF432 domain-containing protein [Nitrosopumilus sp.]|nr:DUF432 domain-containing protein [Nitrosopumilus sp.]
MGDDDTNSEYSAYGKYTIDTSLELIFPKTKIKINKIGENVFSYEKLDAEDNIVEKIIPTFSSVLTLEITPIRPLNHPARRTNYLYLDIGSPIFLSSGSSADVFVNCPIEIGVFLINGETHESLDWFTCNPNDSRFCLYGSPESGTLCKYAHSEIVESHDSSIPYINGVMKINLKNDLSRGLTISKLVFPITEHSLYYKDTKAIFDTLTTILKKKLTLEIFDGHPLPIQTDWTISPTYERAEHNKAIDMGVD